MLKAYTFYAKLFAKNIFCFEQIICSLSLLMVSFGSVRFGSVRRKKVAKISKKSQKVLAIIFFLIYNRIIKQMHKRKEPEYAKHFYQR